jgi:hypothetical protein
MEGAMLIVCAGSMAAAPSAQHLADKVCLDAWTSDTHAAPHAPDSTSGLKCLEGSASGNTGHLARFADATAREEWAARMLENSDIIRSTMQ